MSLRLQALRVAKTHVSDGAQHGGSNAYIDLPHHQARNEPQLRAGKQPERAGGKFSNAGRIRRLLLDHIPNFMLRHLHLLQRILPNRRDENAATKNSSDSTSLPKGNSD
jgi:hypothetical protein